MELVGGQRPPLGGGPDGGGPLGGGPEGGGPQGPCGLALCKKVEKTISRRSSRGNNEGDCCWTHHKRIAAEQQHE